MNPIRSDGSLTFAGAGFLAADSASLRRLPERVRDRQRAQPTRADAEKDPVLKAMLTELDRSKSQLQLKDFQKPFFIQYRIEDD
jgi:hypothetical protein